MKEIDTIIKLLTNLIPGGTKQELEINGVKYKLTKEGNDIKIDIFESFDDSEIKEVVSEYKENIKELDDDLFVEVTEELATKFDLKEFNDLLDLESYNEDQAKEVENMLDVSSDIICQHLQNKIEKLVKLYENF